MSSMKDVARLAGVSASTVSRVISQNIPVDEETKQKVNEAIRKLNYKPNLLAQGLRVKSGYVIGLVVPELVSLHAFASIIRYTEESVSEKGFHLIVGNNHNSPEIEKRFIEDLIRRHVDGIVFSRVSDESQVLRLLDNRDIPIVVIDRALENEDIPSVVVHNYRAGELAAEHLVSLGHKRIACITGPLNIALCRDRVKGFKQVLMTHGIQFDERWLVEGNFKLDAGVRGVEFLLENHPNITGVWAQNDIMAAGVIKALYRRGLKVPDDLSVIGMDDSDLADIMTPELTTIKQPFKEMTAKAVEMIIKQREEHQMPEKMIVLEPSLIIRETTAAVK
jgi:LacI family transcriptional regulator